MLLTLSILSSPVDWFSLLWACPNQATPSCLSSWGRWGRTSPREPSVPYPCWRILASCEPAGAESERTRWAGQSQKIFLIIYLKYFFFFFKFYFSVLHLTLNKVDFFFCLMNTKNDSFHSALLHRNRLGESKFTHFLNLLQNLNVLSYFSIFWPFPCFKKRA